MRIVARWVPSGVYMRASLGAVKCLYFLGFHRLNARCFGGAEAPAWALYRHLYGDRP